MERIVKDIARREPTTIIENEALFIACRLAKAGYYGGNPEKILKAPIDLIIGIINYESFENDIGKAYNDLRNQEDK